MFNDRTLHCCSNAERLKDISVVRKAFWIIKGKRLGEIIQWLELPVPVLRYKFVCLLEDVFSETYK